jgi:exopolysaccharide biosynthesis polyprenyl glycosylphosphotransferase
MTKLASEAHLDSWGAPADFAVQAERPVRRRSRGWIVKRMLVLADVIGLGTAFVLTEYASMETGGQASAVQELLVFLAVIPAWVLAAKLYGLYDRDEDRADHSTADELVGVFNAISIGAWVLVAVGVATRLIDVNLPKIFLFWILAVAFVSIARAVARTICRRLPAYAQRTLIVGTGRVGHRVARQIRDHPEYGLELVGFVDASPAAGDRRPNDIHVVGTPEDLPALVENAHVDRVIFAFSSESHDTLLPAVRACRDLPARIDVVPRFFDAMGSGATVHSLGGMALIGLGPSSLPRSSQVIKRAVDVAVSATALVLLAPVLAAIALLIKLDSPGPVHFTQLRMGTRGNPFRMRKFRTMVVGADDLKHEVVHLNHYAVNGGDTRMFKAKDDPRTTRVGRVLRRYSLDELPQLVNVLRGDMSMVGPRPLILDEDQHIADWGRRRLDLKPGITGPWQVLGRNGIPLDEMVTLDYLYVTNWSLMQDLVLMLRTLPAVVRSRDVY